jgi:hypothetical protein
LVERHAQPGGVTFRTGAVPSAKWSFERREEREIYITAASLSRGLNLTRINMNLTPRAMAHASPSCPDLGKGRKTPFSSKEEMASP